MALDRDARIALEHLMADADDDALVEMADAVLEARIGRFKRQTEQLHELAKRVERLEGNVGVPSELLAIGKMVRGE